MNKRFAGGVLLVCGVFLATANAADDRITPEEEIRYRQSVMTVMGKARAEIQDMVKKGNYDPAVARKNVDLMVLLAPLASRGYAPGTERGWPTKSDLKIWKEQAKFKQEMDKMVAEINKLPAVAANKDKMKEALGSLGKVCKSCHDTYSLVEYRNN